MATDKRTSANMKNKTSNNKSAFEETINVKGEELVGKIKSLVKEGNVRRIIIKDKNGKDIIQIPLTLGVVGAVLAPALAAVGAIAALVTECSITVQRENNPKS